MSGLLGFTFRQGNRSEYLALYILSALGVAVPVPRQEDIGVDLHCSLANEKKGLLYFQKQFLVQIKSKTAASNWTLGGMKKGKPHGYEVEWFFAQELPLFLASVDKNEQRLSLYTTCPAMIAYYKAQPFPGKMTFQLDTPADSGDIPGPIQGNKIPKAPRRCGDQHNWIINLGPPILTLTATEAENKKQVKKARDALSIAIERGLQNINYKAMNIPYVEWLLNIVPNEKCSRFGGYLVDEAIAKLNLKAALKFALPAVASLGLKFRNSPGKTNLDKLCGMAELMRTNNIHIPKFVQKSVPELFPEE